MPFLIINFFFTEVVFHTSLFHFPTRKLHIRLTIFFFYKIIKYAHKFHIMVLRIKQFYFNGKQKNFFFQFSGMILYIISK